MPVFNGRSPDAKPCPRCGRVIGGRYGRLGLEQAKHKAADGRWCRVKRAPETGAIDGKAVL